MSASLVRYMSLEFYNSVAYLSRTKTHRYYQICQLRRNIVQDDIVFSRWRGQNNVIILSRTKLCRKWQISRHRHNIVQDKFTIGLCFTRMRGTDIVRGDRRLLSSSTTPPQYRLRHKYIVSRWYGQNDVPLTTVSASVRHSTQIVCNPGTTDPVSTLCNMRPLLLTLLYYLRYLTR